MSGREENEDLDTTISLQGMKGELKNGHKERQPFATEPGAECLC
jgi:hypothetical protein